MNGWVITKQLSAISYLRGLLGIVSELGTLIESNRTDFSLVIRCVALCLLATRLIENVQNLKVTFTVSLMKETETRKTEIMMSYPFFFLLTNRSDLVPISPDVGCYVKKRRSSLRGKQNVPIVDAGSGIILQKPKQSFQCQELNQSPKNMV